MSAFLVAFEITLGIGLGAIVVLAVWTVACAALDALTIALNRRALDRWWHGLMGKPAGEGEEGEYRGAFSGSKGV